MKRSRVFVVLIIAAATIGIIILSSQSTSSLHVCFNADFKPADITDDFPVFNPGLEVIDSTNADKVALLDNWAYGTLSENDFGGNRITFATDGRVAGLATGTGVRIVDIFTGEASYFEQSRFVFSIVFDNQSRVLAFLRTSDSEQRTNDEFQLIEVDARVQRAQLQLEERERIEDVAFSPSGNCIVFASGGLRVWDIHNNIQLNPVHTVNFVNDVEFSADGKYLAYGTDGDNDSVGPVAVVIWDLEKNQELHVFRELNAITTIAFSPGGELLASGGLDNLIHIWSVVSGQELFTLNNDDGGAIELRYIDDGAIELAFNPDGNILAASSSNDKIINLRDMQTGQKLTTLDTEKVMYGLTFSQDSKVLVSVSGGDFYYWGIE